MSESKRRLKVKMPLARSRAQKNRLFRVNGGGNVVVLWGVGIGGYKARASV
ncbi:MAG: hypothetical protein LBC35_00745 [Coriobacteriales bacterium]|nr:hypothetical protein [Coriobacteriales bacterium]